MDTSTADLKLSPDSSGAYVTPSDLSTLGVHKRGLHDDPGQHYFLYVPRMRAANSPLLVAVHGISRNAAQLARSLARKAERYGVVLVAPLFDEQRYPDYQRIGRAGRGERADCALERILTEVRQLTAANVGKFYLFGYSGGGQFAHRYAMANPARVAGMVIGAAGWYTAPDPHTRFPRGMKAIRALPDTHFALEPFLRIPTAVVVGEYDTERDLAFNQKHRLDVSQGSTRVERGRRWIKQLRALAQDRGLATAYSFDTLPESDHSFRRCVKRGRLHKYVFRFLFGKPPAKLAGSSPRRNASAAGVPERAQFTGGPGVGASATYRMGSRVDLQPLEGS